MAVPVEKEVGRRGHLFLRELSKGGCRGRQAGSRRVAAVDIGERLEPGGLGSGWSPSLGGLDVGVDLIPVGRAILG